MFRDHDFDENASAPPLSDDLVHDLDLETLFAAMGQGDPLVRGVSRIGILCPVSNSEQVTYRQEVLTDCIANAGVVRELYELASSVFREKRQLFWYYRRNSPTSIMAQTPQMISMYVRYLKEFRGIVDQHGEGFTSQGWTTLFTSIREELGDDYFALIDEMLKSLRFKDGELFSARLGFAAHGVDYVLRDPSRARPSFVERLGVGGRKSYSFEIAPRDEAGAEFLERIRAKGLSGAANALAQAADHMSSFFARLQIELAFYVGCINLHRVLSDKGETLCMPHVQTWSPARLDFSGLYDPCLSLRRSEKVVGNTANCDNARLVVVTGANSGGKSTFLRSLSTAYLMMSAGLFVAAESFAASMVKAVFTHFMREEDPSMSSGKLDEELSRMSVIADHLGPHCVVAFNESFSATNEREGTEIARQVLAAVLDSDVRAIVVTHLSELAEYFYECESDTTAFLRAMRGGAGGELYRLEPGPPLDTGFGLDVYERLGGW